MIRGRASSSSFWSDKSHCIMISSIPFITSSELSRLLHCATPFFSAFSYLTSGWGFRCSWTSSLITWTLSNNLLSCLFMFILLWDLFSWMSSYSLWMWLIFSSSFLISISPIFMGMKVVFGSIGISWSSFFYSIATMLFIFSSLYCYLGFFSIGSKFIWKLMGFGFSRIGVCKLSICYCLFCG